MRKRKIKGWRRMKNRVKEREIRHPARFQTRLRGILTLILPFLEQRTCSIETS
jgi:hypothetical protein